MEDEPLAKQLSEIKMQFSAILEEIGCQYDDYIPKISKAISQKRLQHTLGVVKQAIHLANLHGVAKKEAVLSSLLHDVAKEMPLQEMQNVLLDAKRIDERFYENANILHGYAGARVAKQHYAIKDEAILCAITHHTVGKENMSPLDLVLFVADATEQYRPYFPGLSLMREASVISLELGAYLSLLLTKNYLKEQNKPMSSLSLDTEQWLSRCIPTEISHFLHFILE